MKTRSEKGAAVVEFAVILPLLLLIVFGIVEFGFMLYNKAMITNAAREGARYGIVAATTRKSSTQISDEVAKYCSDFLVTFSSGADPGPTTNVCVTDLDEDGNTVSFICPANPALLSTSSVASAEDLITVEVTYDYRFIILPNFIGGGWTKTLFASSTMRYE